MRILSEAKKWGDFVKISHTIFALPFALSAMVLASKETNGWPGWKLFLLIIFCMFFARTSAMAFNRIVDRKFDAKNPRTADRHLPKGKISLASAWTLCAASGIAFIATTFFISFTCFYLSPVALLTVYFYSLTKRFTNFTHIFLGLALSLAPVGAWLAVKGNFSVDPVESGIWIPILMGLGVTLWLIGFDIIYATQDYDFDKESGLKSVVVKFGIPTSLKIAWTSHFMMWLAFLALGIMANMGWFYFSGLFLIFVGLNYEHIVARQRKLDWVNIAFFRLNALVSLIYLISILLEVWI